MIDYNTALQLKNAGFPQEYRKTYPFMDFAYAVTENISGRKEELHMLHSDNDTGWWLGNDYQSEGDDEKMGWIKCPILTEIIAELGEDFVSLERVQDDTGVRFIATTKNSKFIHGLRIDCSTPEMAVSVLYLAINKK